MQPGAWSWMGQAKMSSHLSMLFRTTFTAPWPSCDVNTVFAVSSGFVMLCCVTRTPTSPELSSSSIARSGSGDLSQVPILFWV